MAVVIRVHQSRPMLSADVAVSTREVMKIKMRMDEPSMIVIRPGTVPRVDMLKGRYKEGQHEG
jgi:hypothetical protein